MIYLKNEQRHSQREVFVLVAGIREAFVRWRSHGDGAFTSQMSDEPKKASKLAAARSLQLAFCATFEHNLLLWVTFTRKRKKEF